MSELSQQREEFCRVYVETDNGSEAYRQAYPRSRHWKPQAVHVAASKLLANDKVAVRVSELKAQKAQEYRREAEKRGVTPAQIIDEQSCSAFLDPAELLDGEGRLLAIRAMPERARRAVKKLKVRKLGEDVEVTEVELNDKLTALRHIGDHLGMYKQEHVHTHKFEDMSEAELRAELARLGEVSAEVAEARAQHGLVERTH